MPEADEEVRFLDIDDAPALTTYASDRKVLERVTGIVASR